LRTRGIAAIDATSRAEDDWVEHVREVGETTLFPLANSWYMGSNVAGKVRVFMPYIGGVGVYRQRCDEVAANDYEGYELIS
jgi:cyclohexanone monooxygenase